MVLRRLGHHAPGRGQGKAALKSGIRFHPAPELRQGLAQLEVGALLLSGQGVTAFSSSGSAFWAWPCCNSSVPRSS